MYENFGMRKTVKLCFVVSALLFSSVLFAQVKADLVENPIANIWAYENDENRVINLDENFLATDITINYQIVANTNPEIALATITDANLTIEFIAHGQSKLIFSATYQETTIYDTIVIGVLPVIEGEFEISNFEDLNLAENSFWNGADETGYFVSGRAVFDNAYESDWGSWSGWAYSNINDVETPGYSNQYAAYTGKGLDVIASGGANYAISYPYTQSVISFIDEGNYSVKGIYITNSTYACLVMKNGDGFAKKFGGINGDDPDWFMLTITGKHQGNETGTIDYYLADFRFDNNDEDYIIETWQYVELSSLGQVDTILFSLSSSDVGDWGMNTPAYFCADNLMFTYEEATEINGNITENISVYPNPASSFIVVETEVEASVSIYSIDGRLVLSQTISDNKTIDVNCFKSGMYSIVIETLNGRTVKKIIIE